MISAFKRTFRRFRFCPKCDHAIPTSRVRTQTVTCPRCGILIREQEHHPRQNNWNRAFLIALTTGLASLLLLCAVTACLYFTNRSFALELRNLRQPRPNHFHFGIDVSQTIRRDVLADFKASVTLRLKTFVGDEMVRYGVSLFGLPGCGARSMRTLFETTSPDNQKAFDAEVAPAIDRIQIAFRGNRQPGLPLTTPLHAFLEKKLTDHTSERIIILSDLVNDVAGCEIQATIPIDTFRRFGLNQKDQLIFFYPPPFLLGRYYSDARMKKLLEEQQAFIKAVSELTGNGELRAFFLPVPEDPLHTFPYFRKHLRTVLPATTYDIIRARVARMLQTIVGAVRG